MPFTATTRSQISNTVTTACPECGTTKAGKLSCCGLGGSWFSKCADEVNGKFAHTWGEGMRVCQSKSKCTSMCRRISVCMCLFVNPLVLQPNMLFTRPQ